MGATVQASGSSTVRSTSSSPTGLSLTGEGMVGEDEGEEGNPLGAEIDTFRFLALLAFLSGAVLPISICARYMSITNA